MCGGQWKRKGCAAWALVLNTLQWAGGAAPLCPPHVRVGRSHGSAVLKRARTTGPLCLSPVHRPGPLRVPPPPPSSWPMAPCLGQPSWYGLLPVHQHAPRFPLRPCPPPPSPRACLEYLRVTHQHPHILQLHDWHAAAASLLFCEWDGGRARGDEGEASNGDQMIATANCRGQRKLGRPACMARTPGAWDDAVQRVLCRGRKCVSSKGRRGTGGGHATGSS